MFRSYFTLALRQLWRNRLYSALNVGGLAAGLAVSTYIGLYAWHEFHYDRFHPHADRTYRVIAYSKFGEDEMNSTNLHEAFGREAKRQLPEVDQLVRYAAYPRPAWLQTDADHRTKPDAVQFADASFLSVMGFSLTTGDPRTALSQPGQIVLTRAVANKLFGPQNPVGKVLIYNKKYPLTVSGVFAEMPTNSMIQFDALVSLSSMPTLGESNKFIWEKGGFLDTYLVLRPGTDPAKTAAKLLTINKNLKESHDGSASFALESLPSLHLQSRQSGSVRQDLYVFMGVALLILILAMTNYVSLTTARATQRAREVGVRKAIGGQRRELIGQFYTESFLTTTLAFGLALILLVVLFPTINQQLDVRMDERVFGQPAYWGLALGLWLACALLAGGYPALMLSRFSPQEALKGSVQQATRGVGLRRILTTGQFAASAGLLLCGLIVYAQMHYIRTKRIGLDRAQVVAVSIDADMAPQYIRFRDAVRNWTGAAQVAATNTRLYTSSIATYFMTTKRDKKQLMVNQLTVDEGFFKTLGIGWKLPPVGWGKQPLTSDIRVYNERTLKEAGDTVTTLPHPDPFGSTEASVQGVVHDFNLFGLQQDQTPACLRVVSDTSREVVAEGGYLLVKLDPKLDVPVALGNLKLLYDQASPPTPFDYYFLDDAYNRLYKKEARLATLVNGFAALTLLVACLGLLGLITFTVEARTKEIGIRKVLGASVSGIVALLSREFVWIVGVAVLIAAPVSWWAMNKWLANFAYHIQIEWWMVAAVAGVSIAIALLTVSFQSTRVALMNPVKSLRSE